MKNQRYLFYSIQCQIVPQLAAQLPCRYFLKVIDKAKILCNNASQNPTDHFVDVNKTIPMPKGAAKDVDDYMLTRGYVWRPARYCWKIASRN
jgi:hypothetical protein